MDAYEREENDIDQREADGFITREQARKERADLQRDYRGQAEEAAMAAYNEEMNRW